jgi:hypothetical protein
MRYDCSPAVRAELWRRSCLHTASLLDLSARNELRATIPAAAARLGVASIRMPVRNAVEIEDAISAFTAVPNDGLLWTGAAPDAIYEAIGRVGLHYHLPLMNGWSRSFPGGTPSKRGLPDDSWP